MERQTRFERKYGEPELGGRARRLHLGQAQREAVEFHELCAAARRAADLRRRKALVRAGWLAVAAAIDAGFWVPGTGVFRFVVGISLGAVAFWSLIDALDAQTALALFPAHPSEDDWGRDFEARPHRAARS